MADKEKISVIGLGKLGAPIAACFAKKGFIVSGFDSDSHRTSDFAQGRSRIIEPDLREFLNEAKDRVFAAQSASQAVEESDVCFLVVPTPSEPSGHFSLDFVLKAAEEIGVGLARKEKKTLIVLTSTVTPGSTGVSLRKVLEEVSGKVCGEDFGLCYSPAFIALGQVIKNFLNPDFVLIGESDSDSGGQLEALYQKVCDNSPLVRRMNFVNAELTKLALNSYVTTKISFANNLARICENMPGGDVDVVTGSIGLDARVGTRYLKGAVGFGGPCFPRDNEALIAVASDIGVSANIAKATVKSNNAHNKALVTLVEKVCAPESVVGVLGLSYKPDTDVIEESAGIKLVQELCDIGHRVVVFDPLALANAKAKLGEEVLYAETLIACVNQADVLVLTTAWPEFQELPSLLSSAKVRPSVVVDCWRMLACTEIPSDVRLLSVGIGPIESTPTE